MFSVNRRDIDKFQDVSLAQVIDFDALYASH